MQVCLANESQFPRFGGLSNLSVRHSREEISHFEQKYEKELSENSLLVFVPEHLRRDYQSGTNFEFLSFSKPLYSLGEHHYFFLTKMERHEIKEILAQNKPLNAKFLLQYKDCFTQISSGSKPSNTPRNVKKTKTKTKTKITIKEVVEHSTRVEEEEEDLEREAKQELVLLKQTRDWALMKKGLMQEWASMGVELALQQRENSYLRKQLDSQESKINLLCQTMTQFIQQQQGQRQLHSPTTTTTTPTPIPTLAFRQQYRKIKSIEEWIGPNLYGLGEVGTENRTNFGKWDGLFTRQEITPQLLLHYSISTNLHPETKATRLAVKLTYEYPLKMVLSVLEEASYNQAKEMFQKLLQKCPSNYKIVLFATMMMDDSNPFFNEVTNRINLSNILLHCQLILIVNRLNRDGKGEAPDGEYIIQPCKEQESLLKPDFTLIDNYFPSFLSHGPNTYLSYTMGLNVVKSNPQGTGDGIGSNKSCAFCRTRTRIHKNVSGGIQRAHQPKKCPLLATIGNNEVTILLAIRDVVLKSDKKQSDALKNIHSFFGMEDDSDMCGDELNLHNTLLRHATEEEIVAGEHVNGLRLNKAIYAKLRTVQIQLMKLQFQSKLFKELLDIELTIAFSSLHVEGLDMSANLSLASLILDSNGDSFLSTKLNTLTKPTQRKSKHAKKQVKAVLQGQREDEPDLLKDFTNTNQIFFSFQQQYNAIYANSMQSQCQFFNFEKEQQQVFISNYCYPTMSPMMTDFSMPISMNVNFLPLPINV